MNKDWVPSTINTDQNPAYIQSIKSLKQSHEDYTDIKHRRIKYHNNRIESDHGKLKRLIKPMLGFKSMKSARAIIAGFEVMCMFKNGQFNFWLKMKRKTEAEFIKELFEVYA